jgi:hypothetical protein
MHIPVASRGNLDAAAGSHHRVTGDRRLRGLAQGNDFDGGTEPAGEGQGHAADP